MQHSQQTLIEMSEALEYEIVMLYSTAAYIHAKVVDQALKDREDEGLIARNAMVESFGLHARVLADFLYEKPSKDETNAASYIPGWKKNRPDGLNAEMIRANKTIAHLTTRRAGPDATAYKQWNYTALVDLLRPHLLAFAREVADSLVHAEFKGSVIAAIEAEQQGRTTKPDRLSGIPPSLITAMSVPVSGGTATQMYRPKP